MMLKGAGIYTDVPFSDYHDDCCPGPSVSASTLWLIESRNPAYARARHYLAGAARVQNEGTEATRLGTAAHLYILEGIEAFERDYVVNPGYDLRTRDGKDWRATVAGTRIIIDSDDFSTICAMAKAIGDNPASRNAFKGGKPEQTLVACTDFFEVDKDAVPSGIWLKARPDYLKGNLALNLKTAAIAKREPWERQAASLGYYASAALSIDVMAAVGIPAPLYGFVIVEKDPPHSVVVRVFDDAAIGWGREVYRRALRTFADCHARGVWPGYSDTVETVGLPAWAERTLEKRHEAGDFAEPARKSEWDPENMLAG